MNKKKDMQQKEKKMENKEWMDKEIAPEIIQIWLNHLSYFCSQEFHLDISIKNKLEILQDQSSSFQQQFELLHIINPYTFNNKESFYTISAWEPSTKLFFGLVCNLQIL